MLASLTLLFPSHDPDDGDEITGIHPQLGLPTIFKTNTIQKYLTEDTTTSNWRATDPFSFIGCPAPYSIATTPIGQIYLSRTGLQVFNGERSELISDVVTPDIEDISQSSLNEVAGVYFDNEYHLTYTSTAGGGGVNDTVLLLDTVRDASRS